MATGRGQDRPNRDIVAYRRALVARWQKARDQGLSAAQAAGIVGVSRATLYRWARDPEPRSRRSRRLPVAPDPHSYPDTASDKEAEYLVIVVLLEYRFDSYEVGTGR